jgi:hypothetical protein
MLSIPRNGLLALPRVHTSTRKSSLLQPTPQSPAPITASNLTADIKPACRVSVGIAFQNTNTLLRTIRHVPGTGACNAAKRSRDHLLAPQMIIDIKTPECSDNL